MNHIETLPSISYKITEVIWSFKKKKASKLAGKERKTNTITLASGNDIKFVNLLVGHRLVINLTKIDHLCNQC